MKSRWTTILAVLVCGGLAAQGAAISPASGGTAISADTYAGAFTPLTGPVIVETLVGDISVGTLMLTLPAGFEFDTNAPLPVITLSGDKDHKNINGLSDGDIVPLTVTTNTLSFTITSKSKGQTRNTLTYSNIRVRPTAGTPLASGNITNTGTSTFPNSRTNFGTLTEVSGSRTQSAVSGFPSPQTASVAGAITVTARDQFGNVVSNFAGTVHFCSSDPFAILPADYTFVSGDNGMHTFSGVILKTIGAQAITASNMVAGSLSGTQSGISIVPAAADQPSLQAFLSTNSSRQLMLFGKVGVRYELQYSTNLALPGAWDLAWSYIQTNETMTIEVGSVYSNIFYRIYQP